MNPTGTDPIAAAPRHAYDVFLSHNRADKEWVRELARWLADQPHNGRRLRPWLDEQFLDPGELGSDAELTTAMDRARSLALVLSPEAMGSYYVGVEIEYFLRTCGAGAIVPLLRRDCTPPPALEGVEVLDFREGSDGAEPRHLLLERLRAGGAAPLDDVARDVDEAFRRVEATETDGFHAEPTPERDAFCAVLLRYDIDDLDAEGLALAAWERAAGHVVRVHRQGSGIAYGCRMLLGECLAAALHRSPGYRVVVQRVLDRAAADGDDSVLPFVVARAYSKLAEIDISRIDPGGLLRLARQLDSGAAPTNQTRVLETMLGRAVGKIRDRPTGELLIKMLCEGGRASQMIALGAISLSYHRSEPVYFLSELERLRAASDEEAEAHLPAPSRRLLGELSALGLGDEARMRAMLAAQDELARAYPGIGRYYGSSWFRSSPVAVAGAQRTPFLGTLRKATRQNVLDLGGRVGATTVACLTESRIVDSLLDGCGALLIPEQETDSPQCRRLQDRGIPFAMIGPSDMESLSDGEHVVVEEGRLRVLRE